MRRNLPQSEILCVLYQCLDFLSIDFDLPPLLSSFIGKICSGSGSGSGPD